MQGFFSLIWFFSVLITTSYSNNLGMPHQILKEIEDTIAYETLQIQQLETISAPCTSQILALYNERGISYFSKQDYNSALADFNYILDLVYRENRFLDAFTGAALWGKALCHACLDQEESMVEDLSCLKYYIVQLGAHNCSCLEHVHNTAYNMPSTYLADRSVFILPVAKFANPDEQISAYECRERVRGTANKLRLF